MEMNGNVPRTRLKILCAIAVIFLAALIFTFAKNMLWQKDDEGQPRITVERGSILDRNGKILAVQTTLYNIAITRSAIQSTSRLFASLLSPTVTEIPEQELLARSSTRAAAIFSISRKKSVKGKKPR